MSSKKEYVLAADIGGTWIRAALADARGRILRKAREATPSLEEPQRGVERLVRLLESVSEGVEREKILGVGVASAGPLDSEKGIILTPPNLPSWRNIPLRAMLEERLGLPVWLENDATLAALGENKFGCGRGREHLIYLTVSTGVGGGIISHGKLILGARGMAGEVGHMVIDPQGPFCNCGKRGCLEAIASGSAIARAAREEILKGASSIIRDLVSSPAEIDARAVVEAARRGDELASEILKRAGRALGIGIANLVHIFDPELVVVGGGVAKAGSLLFDPLREALSRYLMPDFKSKFQLRESALGDDAGLLGAVAFMIEKLGGA